MKGRALCVIFALLLVACGDETVSQSSSCDRYWTQAKTEKDPATREKLFQKALDSSGRTNDLMQVPRLLIDFSDCLVQNNKPAKAEGFLNDALEKIRSALKSSEIDQSQERDLYKEQGRAEFVLARALAESNRPQEANKKFKSAIASHDRGLGNLDVKVEMNKQYISFLKKSGQLEEAEQIELESESTLTSVDDCDSLFEKARDLMVRGEMDKARRILVIAHLAAKKFGPTSNRYRDSLVHMARLEIACGNFARGKQLLLESMDKKNYPTGRGDGAEQRAFSLLGFCYELEGDLKRAAVLYADAGKSYPILPVEELKSLGQFLFKRNFKEEGLVAMRRALALGSAIKQFKRSDIVSLRAPITVALMKMKRYEEAAKILKDEFKEAAVSGSAEAYRSYLCRVSDTYLMPDLLVDDRRFLNGVKIPKRFSQNEQEMIRAMILARLGINYFRAKDYVKSEKLSREALKIGTKLNDRTTIGVAIFNIGDTYRRQNQFKEAEQWYQRGIVLWEKSGNRTAYIDDLYRLAELYDQWGKLKHAKASYLRQWDLLSNDPHPIDPARRFVVGCKIASNAIAEGKYDEARKWIEDTTNEYKKVNGNSQWFPSFIIYSKGDIAFGENRLDDALRLFNEELQYCKRNEKMLAKGMICNSFARILGVADKLLQSNRVEESLKVTDEVMNVFKEIPVGECPGIAQRLSSWITIARERKFQSQEAAWSAILAKHK